MTEPQLSALDDVPSMDIDNALRVIARETGKSDSARFNYYAHWEQCDIAATFGAGVNACRLTLDDAHDGITLYEASDYGQNVIYYRPGKWTKRVILYADELRQVAARREMMQQEEAEAMRRARFEPIDY